MNWGAPIKWRITVLFLDPKRSFQVFNVRDMVGKFRREIKVQIFSLSPS